MHEYSTDADTPPPPPTSPCPPPPAPSPVFERNPKGQSSNGARTVVTRKEIPKRAVGIKTREAYRRRLRAKAPRGASTKQPDILRGFALLPKRYRTTCPSKSLSASKPRPSVTRTKLAKRPRLEKSTARWEAKPVAGGAADRRRPGEFRRAVLGCWRAPALAGTRFTACSSAFQLTTLLRGENRSFCLLAEFAPFESLPQNRASGLGGALGVTMRNKASGFQLRTQNPPRLIKRDFLVKLMLV